MLTDVFQCAACWPHPKSIHIDGNLKLGTFDRGYEPWRSSTYYGEEGLFLPDEMVVDHLDALDLALYGQKRSPLKVCLMILNCHSTVDLWHSCAC
jgi:hypothetical protein